MNIQEARKVLWLKNNRRPLGELLDEGFLTQSQLEWAAEKAYDSELKEAAKVILEWLKRPNREHSATIEPAQQQVSALSVGISLEKARATSWPFSPYKGKPIGELVESKQLSLKDLGYAIENAYDERVRQAAIALSLLRLEQAVKEPAPSAGFVEVISGGRSYAERKQLLLTFIQGAISGAFLGIALVFTVLSFVNSFKPHQQGKTFSEIVSSPMGIAAIIAAIAITAFLGWFPNFILAKIGNKIDKEIDEHRRGEEGEDKVVQLVIQALDGSWKLFRNIVLPGRNKADLDLVLVGPPGIWVLEVKNFRGEYRNIGEGWELRRGKGWKAASVNPSQQAHKNATRLGNFLKADGLKVFANGVVVWANEESPLYVENPSIAIWRYVRLIDELGNIWQGEKLSVQERDKMIAKLTALCKQRESE
jgi:hypothetical protein